jgi:hypothetical protein
LKSSIAENGDSIREGLDLSESVADVEDRDPLVFPKMDFLEKPLGFSGAQGCGWFIEDEDLGRLPGICGDFEQLLLSDSEA